MKTIVLGVMIIGMFLGCQNSTPTASQGSNPAKGQQEAMMTRTGPISKALKPPIDLSAPANTETATFALG
jgi:hypothetical protein